MPEIPTPNFAEPIVDKDGRMTDNFQRWVNSITNTDLIVGTGSPENVVEAMRSFPRQALHARLLAFEHPEGGERLSFETELPSDMKTLCNILESI